ncbi:MAG TPA: hypothetical protein VK912_02280 [Longimicrobiales bacterium]|nr:hypothetical protein [Longimicrobiales bacterium]
MDTTRWPGASNANSALLMAAMTVAKLVAAAAPSSAHIFASNVTVVGFVLRE